MKETSNEQSEINNIQNESDSDNEIENLNNNLNIPSQSNLPSVKDRNKNDNDSTENLRARDTNATKRSSSKQKPKSTNYNITKFIIVLSIALVFFLINIILGAIIWANKKSFFGRIFCLLGIFGFIICLFNLISVIFFKKKFNSFKKEFKNSVTEIELLEQGNLYDNLLKSTESSLMNFGMYLLLLEILLNLIYCLAVISFTTLIIPEVNSLANNTHQWSIAYNKMTYNEIVKYLQIFNALFGVLSAISIGILSYLFYISFTILGFFHIYQKIVQFTSMLYLQIGIALLYLSVWFKYFRDLAFIDEQFVHWLPKAVLISSIIVIFVSLIGYTGAANKSITWLIPTCIITGLFLSMFMVFCFISVISGHSLNEYNDMKCPVFLSYFNFKYTNDNLSCQKYVSTSFSIDDLNCPKERIVTNWEYELKTQLTDEKKKIKYGCINMSCCYEIYNFIQSFHNYLTMICFITELFGLVFLGTLLYLINLIQQKGGYSVDEKTSQYFIYLFVGIIGGFFIYLLIKMNVPSFSPSFSNKFNDAKRDKNSNSDLIFTPMSIIKKNATFYSQTIELLESTIIREYQIEEDNCGKNCNKLRYIANLTSDDSDIEVNEDKMKDNNLYYSYPNETNHKILIVKGHKNILNGLFSSIEVKNKSKCEMSQNKIHFNLKGKGYSESKENDKSFIQLNKKSSQQKIYTITQNNNGIVITIDMSLVNEDEEYILFDNDIDFSIANYETTQNIEGEVYAYNSENKLEPAENQIINIAYKNFKNCEKFETVTNKKGYFKVTGIPILKNNILNEVKLSFDNNELSKTILIGGIGNDDTINLNRIILQKNFFVNNDNDENSYFSFSSYVVDSISIEPINNVSVSIFEGDVYFPNFKSNETKYNYDTLNNEYLIRTTHTDKKGYFEFKENLKNSVYTILISKIGYYKTIELLDIKNKTDTKDKDILSFSLTPILNKNTELEIILDWKKNPIDLNLFSFFKQSDTFQCEVYFGNYKCLKTSIENTNYNNGTQGSQIMKIEKLGKYIYTFAVKQFKVNDNPISRNEIKVKGAENKAPEEIYPNFQRKLTYVDDHITLMNSNATIKIFVPGFEREVYKISMEDIFKEENNNEWWIPFCINGENGIKSIKKINKFVKEQPDYSYCEKIYESDNDETDEGD